MLKDEKATGGITMSERNTFSIRIQPDLMKALKMLAADKDTTMSDLIEEAIQELLKKGGVDGKKQTRK